MIPLLRTFGVEYGFCDPACTTSEWIAIVMIIVTIAGVVIVGKIKERKQAKKLTGRKYRSDGTRVDDG
jgi:hypothetical protein